MFVVHDMRNGTSGVTKETKNILDSSQPVCLMHGVKDLEICHLLGAQKQYWIQKINILRELLDTVC